MHGRFVSVFLGAALPALLALAGCQHGDENSIIPIDATYEVPPARMVMDNDGGLIGVGAGGQGGSGIDAGVAQPDSTVRPEVGRDSSSTPDASSGTGGLDAGPGTGG